MASNSGKTILAKDIKRIESKIREIHYLEKFEMGEKFEQKLSNVIQNLSLSNDRTGLDENEKNAIVEISQIEFEIDDILKAEQKRLNRDTYMKKLNDMLQNIDTRTTR